MTSRRNRNRPPAAPAADDGAGDTDDTSVGGGEWSPTTDARTDAALAKLGDPQPNLDDMIGGAAGSAAPSTDAAVSALDNVRDSLRESAPPADATPAAPLGYNLDGTPKTTKRGRPSNRARVEGSAPAAPVRDTRDAAKSRAGEPRETKTELADTIAKQRAKIAELEAQRAAALAISDEARMAQLAGLLEMAGTEGFGALAEIRGDHWALSPDEAEKFGRTGAPALAPHAAFLNEHGPWIMFGLTCLQLVRTRLKIDAANERAGIAPHMQPRIPAA